jgi:hypothetical protein
LYRETFHAYKTAKAALEKVEAQERHIEELREFARFEIQKIEEVSPKIGEDEELMQFKKMLSKKEKLEEAFHLQAKTFATVMIENTSSGSWKITPLPRLAQLSSVNSILVQDVNKDSFLDVVLAGNLYESEVETPRNDAGNGLVLIGDGENNFRPLYPNESGFFAPKNVRIVSTITIDKKENLIVFNNSDSLKLFSFK